MGESGAGLRRVWGAGEVLSYLFLIVFSFAMIGYILLWLSFWKGPVPLDVFFYFFAFSAIIAYNFFRLARVLFPEWRLTQIVLGKVFVGNFNQTLPKNFNQTLILFFQPDSA